MDVWMPASSILLFRTLEFSIVGFGATTRFESENSTMKAIILCGGLGTRLREETEFRPKPMVEIGGRPILWHIIKIFNHWKIEDFVLCLGYRGNMIKEYFLNYEPMNSDFSLKMGSSREITYHDIHQEQNIKVTLAETGAQTMTGGRLLRVERYLRDEPRFLVTYGDGVADINIEQLLDFHRSHGKLATISTVQPASRFGILDVQKNGEVCQFQEKPKLEGWVNIGYMVFERNVFDYLRDEGDACILEQTPLRRLAEEGQLRAYHHPGSWHAMDTYREYQQLNELWSSGKAPWQIWKS